jgi:hypothetical protein
MALGISGRRPMVQSQFSQNQRDHDFGVGVGNAKPLGISLVSAAGYGHDAMAIYLMLTALSDVVLRALGARYTKGRRVGA